MSQSRFIEPNDNRSPLEQAIDVLRGAGCDLHDANWLAVAFMDPRVLAPEHALTEQGELSDRAICRIEYFGKAYAKCILSHRSIDDSKDLAVLSGIEELRKNGDATRSNYLLWPLDGPELVAFIEHCCNAGIEVTNGLRLWKDDATRDHYARTLYDQHAIQPERLVCWETVLQTGKLNTWYIHDKDVRDAQVQSRDPTCLLFWLRTVDASALDFVIPRLREVDPSNVDGLIVACRGIGWIIQAWAWLPAAGQNRHPSNYCEWGSNFTQRAELIFNILDAAITDASAEDRQRLVDPWLRFGRMAFDRRGDSMDHDLRGRIYRAAADEIGRLRPLFRVADQTDARNEFLERKDLYELCVKHVLDLGTLWDGMKPILLAFLSLNAQAVASDLRYWYEPDLDGEETPSWLLWSALPMNFAAAVHNYGGYEQSKGDPELIGCRDQFAKFCLERIKTRKPRKKPKDAMTQDPAQLPMLVEPDPLWRECFIRAARELRINPDGKGHQILFHAMQNDPDERVRDAANLAYEEFRSGWASARSISPRTLLLRAFAWIRQGHLLSLGISPDPAGVQRTRDIERRRTSEPH